MLQNISILYSSKLVFTKILSTTTVLNIDDNLKCF